MVVEGGDGGMVGANLEGEQTESGGRAGRAVIKPIKE